MDKETPLNIDHLISENEQLKSLIKRISNTSEKWYQSLFNTNSGAIVICESDSDFPSIIVDYNIEFGRLLKYKPKDIIGKDFMELLRQGERRKLLLQTFGKTRDKHIKEYPFVFIDGTGNEITLEISTNHFDSYKGSMFMVKVQPQDKYKTELRNGIEELLSYSNQIFFGIKNNGILEFDYISHSVYKVTGFSSDQLLLNPFLFWNNCHPEDLAMIQNIIKKKTPFETKNSIRFIRQDGQMIWLELLLISCPSKNKTYDYYAIAYEITNKHKKERHYKKKDKYERLILQNAKTLITVPDKTTLNNFAKNISKHLLGERFSLYINKESGPSFSYNYFSNKISINDQADAVSNEILWNKLKDIFVNIPIISFQSDKDSASVDPAFLSFLIRIRIQSALIIPIGSPNQSFGFMACTTITKLQRWDRSDINYYSQLSQLLSHALGW